MHIRQVSTFFTKTSTATVCAFMYVFGSGLLANLLLQTYMGLDEWWVNIVEVVPSFALYRGVRKISLQ